MLNTSVLDKLIPLIFLITQILTPSVNTKTFSANTSRFIIDNQVEQAAVANITNLIQQTNLSAPLTNIQSSINALATHLADISTNSVRYTPIIALLNAFLDALIAQTLTTLIAASPDATDFSAMLALIDPLFTILKNSFTNNDVLLEINKLYATTQQTLNWTCQLNQISRNRKQLATLSTQNARLLLELQDKQQIISQQMPDNYLDNTIKTLTAQNTNINYALLTSLYTDIVKKLLGQ